MLMNTRVFFPDINGAARGKLILGDHFDAQNPKNFRVSRSVLAQDFEGDEVAALPEYHPSSGDLDLIGALDMNTYQKAPAQEGLMQVIADVQDMDGTPLPIAPRHILKRAIAAINELGFGISMASELEFYITKPDGTRLDATALTGIAADVTPYVVMQRVIEDMVDAATLNGLDPESIYTEGGMGQVEINFAPTDPLTMCDRTLYFKQAMRETAIVHGFAANFMAKPYADISGSGFHVHFSLTKDGRNVFVDDEKLLEHAVTGLVAYAPEAFALFKPTINSFRRHVLAAGYAPQNFSYGEEGRQLAVRVTNNGSRHIEFRIAGSDANQYLLFAYMLFAVAEGIKQQLTYQSENVQRAASRDYPATLEHSLDEMKQSDFMKQCFGEKFVQAYDAVKRQELIKFAAQITDWERRVLSA